MGDCIDYYKTEKEPGVCVPTLFPCSCLERKKLIIKRNSMNNASCLALLGKVWDRGNQEALSHGKNE